MMIDRDGRVSSELMNFVGLSRSISAEEVSSLLCVSETEDDLRPAGGEKEASRERLDMMTWTKIWLSRKMLLGADAAYSANSIRNSCATTISVTASSIDHR
jgi:hypothetical protein